ncbi:FG-GAP repeat domain-containing protein [Streptomyces sp. NPDC050504]|uniref:FG-GAP repeat domain-containing protein n=1 Tax=Streptomyces sp. NPDC050504 TaxID=3365618 RepID=UPI0037985F5A
MRTPSTRRPHRRIRLTATAVALAASGAPFLAAPGTAVAADTGTKTTVSAAPAAASAASSPSSAPASSASASAAPEEVVIPAEARRAPRSVHLSDAGSTGYVSRQEGSDKYFWTDSATGETRPTTRPDRNLDHSGLRVTETYGESGYRASIRSLATGAVTEFDFQADDMAVVYTADTVTVARVPDTGITGLSILRKTGDTVVETPVTGFPAGAERVWPTHLQDLEGAFLDFHLEGEARQRFYLDYATGKLRPVSNARFSDIRSMGDEHLVLWAENDEGGVVRTVPRDDPSATPTRTPLPAQTPGERPFTVAVAVGDRIVFRKLIDPGWEGTRAGYKLQSVPVGGGEARELLPQASEELIPAPGGAMAVGGTKASDWAVRRITTGPDGEPVLTRLQTVAPIPTKVQELALGAGRLHYVADSEGSSTRALYERDTALSGTPVPGERRVRSYYGNSYGGLRSLGDGLVAHGTDWGVSAPLSTSTAKTVHLGGPGSLVAGTGRYTVTNSDDGRQYVADFEQHGETGVVLTRSQTAAALWGPLLWKPGRTSGTVSWTNLATKKNSADFPLGSGCSPTELQVVGRWVYWVCGTSKAGVWDSKTRVSKAVPRNGEVLLGDGYLVRNDKTLNKLVLTDFHEGGDAPVTTRVFSDAPPSDSAGRGIGWTVDRFGGHVAYTDAQQRIHIKPVTVPRSAVGVVDARVDGAADFGGRGGGQAAWAPEWLLSRPVARWSLALKEQRTGRTVRTVSGTVTTPEGAVLKAGWDGKDADGKPVVNGPYAWTLSADAGDGAGTRAVTSGVVRAQGGTAPFRDHDGDGEPELLTRRQGELSAHQGPGMNRGIPSAGWSGVNHVVALGDVDRDGANDLLVRTTAGDLYRYAEGRGLPRPGGARVRIGRGFSAFDVLTAPGDMTGDGRPDLVARQRTTGDVYLYATTATGGLRPGVKIGSKWTGFRAVIGAGDLNGDGVGDLLAVDKADNLWRYEGRTRADGSATVRPGVLAHGAKWAANRNAFVGVGDLDANGTNDLLTRDTSGRLLRNLGTGRGTFGATAVLGTGWQPYEGLY